MRTFNEDIEISSNLKKIFSFFFSFLCLILIWKSIELYVASYYVNSPYKLIFEGFSNVLGAVIGIGLVILSFKLSPIKKPVELIQVIKIKPLKVQELFVILIIIILSLPIVHLLGDIGKPFFDNSVNRGFDKIALEFPFFMVIFWGAICGPIAEELVFRGYVLNSFQYFHPVASISVTVMSFSIFHFNSYQALYTIPTSIVFTLVAFYTQNLMASISAHIFNNFLAFVLSKYLPNLELGVWYLVIPCTVMGIYLLYRMGKSYVKYTYVPLKLRDIMFPMLFLITFILLAVFAVKEKSLLSFLIIPILGLLIYQLYAKFRVNVQKNINF
ncbi:CPBP family intramembrane metalloprotease [Bacillus pseudomycoides]|uniref:CPBP family intramembrane glutamic endopeptidase n=1 Tax=Bacillus pseudomycoides TaxID=64104 RepID=UPI00215B1FCD|nr:CPBP family intramembrane metalloprotease [Bacillus pseudomycoides]MCR8860373.1 CPBP family intramembrane metalloprotease [Bacillus pseudomycoides]